MAKDKELYVRDLTIDDEYDIINSSATVKDAAMKMKEDGIPDLVVVAENDQKVLGVIADFDIVTGLVAEGLSAETAKVTEVMYTIEPVTPDTPVSTAFSRMRDLDVSVVPVIEEDKLSGVATITDCWGYLPEKYEDQKGIISVSNPRFANYSFTILMTALYFGLGILAPLIGITGYLKAPVAGSAVYSATYYIFDARGGNFFVSYLDLFMKTASLTWLGITIYGFLFLILGIFSTFAIYQWAYSDYKLLKETRNWQAIGVVVGVLNLVIEWILFIALVMVGSLRVASTEITLDFGGILISGIAIIFLLAAVSRDILFKESVSTTSEEK
ncbi:MAG: CBS domain-containing protein [Candidatus Hodarchaeales archaeon]